MLVQVLWSLGQELALCFWPVWKPWGLPDADWSVGTGAGGRRTPGWGSCASPGSVAPSETSSLPARLGQASTSQHCTTNHKGKIIMLIHQCMLHYLFKIVLFYLNSTTMRNSVVLVELWKANFFFCQRNTRENKLVQIHLRWTICVHYYINSKFFDIYLCAENTSFYMFVITVLQNTKGNNFFM